MVIRPILPADAQFFGIPPFSSSTIGWVMEDPTPIGYAAIDPVPGLSHIHDLYGFIAPAYRRQGYGTQFLYFVVQEARQITGVTQLSVPVNSGMSAVKPFLDKHHFYDEHLEYEMICSLQDEIRPNGFRLKRLPHQQAARKMRQLYNLSFQNLAWYQPYVDDEDVLANLGDRGEIYFLESTGEIVGFAGVNYAEDGAEIEPLGVVPAARGEGFGRILLNALLYTFAQRGCKFAQLTVWADNIPALRLYESVGFVRQDARQFMALDL